MIFNLFTGRTDNKVKGYESSDLDEVQAMIIKQCQKKQTALVILSGDIIDNYTPFLKSLSSQLYNLGIVHEQNIEHHELLPLLSGTISLDEAVLDWTGSGYGAKQICYLTGFHQIDYDRVCSDRVLNILQTKLMNDQIYRILILNIPLSVNQYMRNYFPKLWDYAVKYEKEVRQDYKV